MSSRRVSCVLAVDRVVWFDWGISCTSCAATTGRRNGGVKDAVCRSSLLRMLFGKCNVAGLLLSRRDCAKVASTFPRILDAMTSNFFL